jgi:hypothetical protein
MATASTADSERNAPGTLSWIFNSTVVGVGAVSMWFFVGLILTSPALYLVNIFYPAADPFLWLAVLGMSLVLTRSLLTDGFDTPEDMTEDMTDHAPIHRLTYLVSLLIMTTSMMSVAVGVFGGLAAILAIEFQLGIGAVVLALLAPALDDWLAGKTGASVLGGGVLLGIGILTIFERVAGVSAETRTAAASEARRLV